MIGIKNKWEICYEEVHSMDHQRIVIGLNTSWFLMYKIYTLRFMYYKNI